MKNLSMLTLILSLMFLPIINAEESASKRNKGNFSLATSARIARILPLQFLEFPNYLWESARKHPSGYGVMAVSGPRRRKIRLSGGRQFGFGRQQGRSVGAIESGTTTRGQ